MIKAIIVAVTLAVPAQHAHRDGTVDIVVGKFYETWRTPKDRKGWCCNRNDCYPAQIRMNEGRREYLHKWSNRWYPLPDSVLEANQPDPRESPDGGNHVCAAPSNGLTVYCAVLGEGG